MTDDSSKTLTPEDILAAAKLARLGLSAARASVVAPALEGMLRSFDALDAVDLGETAPTNSFDARWRDFE